MCVCAVQLQLPVLLEKLAWVQTDRASERNKKKKKRRKWASRNSIGFQLSYYYFCSSSSWFAQQEGGSWREKRLNRTITTLREQKLQATIRGTSWSGRTTTVATTRLQRSPSLDSSLYPTDRWT